MVNDDKQIALSQESETEQDIQKVMKLIYAREETRKREEGIEKMMIQYLIKQWIPEYSYPGCDRENVVHDYKSALNFTLKIYPSIRKSIKNDKKYYEYVSKSIENSIRRAKRSFSSRKKALEEICKIFDIPENNIKQSIIDAKIDFLKFKVDAFIYVIKLYDSIMLSQQ